MADSKNFTKGLSACLKIVSSFWVFCSLLTILSLLDVQSHIVHCLAILVVLVSCFSSPGLINRAFSPQRVKELEEEAKAKSPGCGGKVDPSLVAEKFLERPRMEQRFFGFRFDDLEADGLSMNLESLNKVFTTLATVQGLELKSE